MNHKLFRGYSELIKTDGPILTEFIKSGKIKFAGVDLKNAAVDHIPDAFYSKKFDADLKVITDGLSAILKNYQISYAFGLGPSNSVIVEAFKEELYNAFKHRLSEAVEAEREAKYDYWWLTFYPKAIPLGDNKLEGQSIIEINFQDSIVQEEQYHRWLQDQSLGKPESKDKTKHKTRLATSVLSDLMIILDNRDLVGKYSDLRYLLLQAIKNFGPTKKPGTNSYKIGIEYLHQLAKAKDKNRIEALNTNTDITIDYTNIGDDKSLHIGTDPISNCIWFLDPKPSKLALELASKLNPKPLGMKDYLSNNQDTCRNALSWERFDIRHVFFAVLAAAEIEAPLPVKVQLYADAYFDGIRRFTSNPSDKERPVEKRFIPTTMYTSNKYKAELFEQTFDLKNSNAVIRYLILKGVKRQEAEKYAAELKKNNSNGDIKSNSVSSLSASAFKQGIPPSSYIMKPGLVSLEFQLDKNLQELRTLIVNLFYSNYPDFPDSRIIQTAFMKRQGRLNSLVYQLLRPLWLHFKEKNIGKGSSFRRVQAQHFVDNLDFLSKDSKRYLVDKLTENSEITYWMNSINKNLTLMDQFRDNLIRHLYSPLFKTLARLEKVERRPVAFKDIKKENFEEFRNLSKPKIQKGIQIIDMLPASRDDLVSMSINEGGVIAKVAGKAEAAAAYDMNKLQMVLRNKEILDQALEKNVTGESTRNSEGLGTLTDNISENVAQGKQNNFNDLSELSRAGESLGYSLGGSGRGSVYARAKAAYSYSKRREYLDAAITAAGRGDNFAKWVVRKSDLRSNLAQGNGDTLVAAAHNGFPNGDQPFHMLVKIPWSSQHSGWNGNPYVLFNSSYVATRRVDSWNKYGNIAPILKGVASIWNLSYWNKLEQSAIGTVYPFKWDVKEGDYEDQRKLLREPNILGGKIDLDDTDKIKYSEIAAMIQAEENFIKLTRQAQLTDVNAVMDNLNTENGDFRQQIRDQLQQDIKNQNELLKDQKTDAGSAEKQQALETDVNKLKEDVKALQQN